ncbi:hypothetical protein KAR91_84105, partial [Candidatus Pacearchaeota archaeon]|nr:hypothetical protein [Candidatus Pacearchaeota archaeon]
MGKTWLERGFLDRRKSTGIDYPPKRKKIWQNDGFMEMEHFHEGGYRPFDTVIPPRILRGSVPDNLREGPRGPQFGCCSGIDLPTVTECDDEWLLGHIQDNYLAIELRATVPGNAVFWSVVGYGTSSGSVIGGPA